MNVAINIDHRLICGALLLAALLAGCGTNAQPTPISATPLSVMTSQAIPAPGTVYPAPSAFPMAETAYPAPTSTP
jgi:hypothetical protein